MIIDGIASSETIDSSGEILKIEGHDISDLVEGRGVLNWEHNNDSPEDIIGKIIFAKKIFTKKDCENDRERMYWDTCKVPFVYIKSELFDDEEHSGAIAAAAIIRYYHKRGEKILAGFSIEGVTLDRVDNQLERTAGRRAALTLKPCNKTAISGVLEDPVLDESVKKYMNTDKVINAKLYEVDSCILEDIEKIEKSELDPVQDLKNTLLELQKTLTAGNYNVAPSQLTNGSSLQTEHFAGTNKKDMKNRLKAAVRDWPRTRPLKEWIKAALPEVSDEYVDHFTDLAHEISLKKGQKPLSRVGIEHSRNKNANDSQKSLINGIYTGQSNDVLTDTGRSNPKVFQNDAGNSVLVKEHHPDLGDHNTAKHATNYYHMANNFFDMADHVPTTNHFDHDDFKTHSNKSAQAIDFRDTAESAFSPKADEYLKTAREDGSLHKLALMDMVTGGNYDRHFANILFDKGKVLHIDNDDSFAYKKAPAVPHYFNCASEDGTENIGIGGDTLHNDAMIWLGNLKPKAMMQEMKRVGMDRNQLREAAKRLKILQHPTSRNKTIQELFTLTNNDKEE